MNRSKFIGNWVKRAFNWPLELGDTVELNEYWHEKVKPGVLHGVITSLHSTSDGEVASVIWNDQIFDMLCYKYGGINVGYLKLHE